MSNNSAHRFTPDVPMIIPEINDDHARIIEAQRARLGTKRGFIAVKSNCSLQTTACPAPAASVRHHQGFGLQSSGNLRSGKTLRPGRKWWTMSFRSSAAREEKSVTGTLKIWGKHRRRPHRACHFSFHHHPVHPGAGFGWASGRCFCLVWSASQAWRRFVPVGNTSPDILNSTSCLPLPASFNLLEEENRP